MATKTMTTYLIDVECECEVHFDAWGATRGHCDSYGVPTEPDEDAGVEINKVLWHTVDVKNNPVVIDITEWVDCDKLEEDLMESFADDDRGDE